MKIGIEGHALEQPRWGLGHTISNFLEVFGKNPELSKDIEFYLYFHKQIPDFDFLKHPKIKLRLIRPPLLKNLVSLNVFYHILLPFAAKKDKIDLMYYPSYLMPVILLIPGFKKIFNHKKLIGLYDISYKAHPEWFVPIRLLNYRISLFNALRNTDAILTISEFSKKEILKYYPKFQPAKIFVNYLAPKTINPKFQPKKELLKKLGIKDKFILTVGQITQRRRVRESIIAFRKIGKEFPDYQFLIIGYDRTYPFYDVDKLISETNKLLGRNAVIRIDYLKSDEELANLYKLADLFSYISSYEGFGLPPIEAMTYGTPTVLKNHILTKEIFENTAFLIDNEKSPEEIADVVKEGLSDTQKRDEIIKKGREVAKKYSWGRHTKKLAEIFNILLNKN